MTQQLKTKITDADPKQYIASLDPKRRAEAELIDNMLAELTGHSGKMWGPTMIGYGSYDYHYPSGRKGTWFRIGFAPRKPSTVIYCMPGFADLSAELAAIGQHKHEKSCLYIKAIDKEKLPALKALAAKTLNIMDEKYPQT
jgi:hypothetical protein